MSEDSKTRQLFQAIEQSNVELARKLIVEDEIRTTDLNEQLYYKVINTAVESRHVLLVRSLLELKPKLDATIAAELLWMVVEDEDTKMATMLVEAGADLNQSTIKDKSERTFLEVLAKNTGDPKKLELALLMMERGAQITAQDGKSSCALLFAIMSENLDFIRELLKRGAAVDENALGIIAILEKQHSVEMMSLLINGDHIKDSTTRTELVTMTFQFICQYSTVNLAKALLDIEIPGFRVILSNLAFTKCEIVKLLFERTDIDKRVKMMFLHHSINILRSHLPLMLIKWGADIEYPVEIEFGYINRGMRPLHVACLCHSEKIVQLLLNLGANVNATDVNGRTPFSFMSDTDLSEAHRLIIKRFALLTSQGVTLNNKDLAIISSCPKFQKFYDDCLRELQVMMKCNGIKMLSTLMKNHRELSLLFRSHKFYEQYKNMLNSFPIYGDDLNCQFKKADELHDLLMPKVVAVYETLDGVLPDVPMEKIIRHLYYSVF